MTTGRIDELGAQVPELGQILHELRGSGLREPVGPDPLLSPTLPAGVLDEFLSLAVRECSDVNLFGLALALPMCAFQRGAGYEALEYCLSKRGLPPDRREFVAGRMLGAKSVADVVWAHGIVIATGNTGLVHSFLSRHAKVVVEKCLDQLATYLLAAGRGPGGYTAGCVEMVLQQNAPGAWPFVRRWLEWLDDGLFDGLSPRVGERPAVLYRILGDNAARETFVPLRDAAHRRVVRLVTERALPAAWRHLAGMVEAGYVGAVGLYPELRTAIEALDDEACGVLDPAWAALSAMVVAGRDPGEAARQRAHQARMTMIQSQVPV